MMFAIRSLWGQKRTHCAHCEPFRFWPICDIVVERFYRLVAISMPRRPLSSIILLNDPDRFSSSRNSLT